MSKINKEALGGARMSNLQFSTKNQNEIKNACDRVVVVAARFALDEYLNYSA